MSNLLNKSVSFFLLLTPFLSSHSQDLDCGTEDNPCPFSHQLINITQNDLDQTLDDITKNSGIPNILSISYDPTYGKKSTVGHVYFDEDGFLSKVTIESSYQVHLTGIGLALYGFTPTATQLIPTTTFNAVMSSEILINDGDCYSLKNVVIEKEIDVKESNHQAISNRLKTVLKTKLAESMTGFVGSDGKTKINGLISRSALSNYCKYEQ